MTWTLDQQIDLKTKLPTKAEDLPEGTHAGQVVKAGIRNIETKNGPATIFEITMDVNGNMHSITYWLTSEPNLRRCLTGLKRLGFEVDQWGPAHGRPYTQELDGAAHRMVGCTLTVKRGTSQNGYATIALEFLEEPEEQVNPTSSDADLPF